MYLSFTPIQYIVLCYPALGEDLCLFPHTLYSSTDVTPDKVHIDINNTIYHLRNHHNIPFNALFCSVPGGIANQVDQRLSVLSLFYGSWMRRGPVKWKSFELNGWVIQQFSCPLSASSLCNKRKVWIVELSRLSCSTSVQSASVGMDPRLIYSPTLALSFLSVSLFLLCFPLSISARLAGL